MRTIEWDDSDSSIKMIDQTLLPAELKIIKCKNVADVCEAIQNLRIRGAPALGVCGASALRFPRSSAAQQLRRE